MSSYHDTMEFDDLKHAQRERLIYLDRCLMWRGSANRRDLMERFGISAAQAALDFRAYLECSETPPAYHSARKTYLAATNHKPLVPCSLTEAFETVLNVNDDGVSCILPQPKRQVDSTIIACLYQAIISRQALHIRYTSIATGADGGQWIAPTHFTSDGESVHLRAFSYKHNQYRDYLPIRIDPKSTFKTRPVSEQLPDDKDWNTRARVWLRPKKGLSPEQADVVRREYGFDGPLLCVETRKPLEFYLDRRWGLDQKGARLERIRTDYHQMRTKVKRNEVKQ
jgi:hypothetical protein